MKTAREMFARLGYNLVVDNEYSLIYQDLKSNLAGKHECSDCLTFTFALCEKEFCKLEKGEVCWITLQEFEAAYQQMVELGWIKPKTQQIEGYKETNLEHYQNELAEGRMLNIAVVDEKPRRCPEADCCKCEFNRDPARATCSKSMAKWLMQPYKPKTQLSRFEYDLLRTNNMSHDKRLNDFSTYENLREIGYFKHVNFDLTIGEILKNCEIKGEENYDEINY